MIEDHHKGYLNVARTTWSKVFLSNTSAAAIEKAKEIALACKGDDEVAKKQARDTAKSKPSQPSTTSSSTSPKPMLPVITPSATKAKAPALGSVALLRPRPFSYTELDTMSQIRLITLRAIADECSTNVQNIDALKTSKNKHVQMVQKRFFAPSTLVDLPLLRMLTWGGVHWRLHKTSQARTIESQMVAAQVFYAEEMYNSIIRPLLRVHCIKKYRDRVVACLRDISQPRQLNLSGLKRPENVGESELVRFWLPWDWKTVDVDIENVPTANGLKREQALEESGELQATHVLSTILQREINKISTLIMNSFVAHSSVHIRNPEEGSPSSPGFFSASAEMAENIRGPYEALMKVCFRGLAHDARMMVWR